MLKNLRLAGGRLRGEQSGERGGVLGQVTKTCMSTHMREKNPLPGWQAVAVHAQRFCKRPGQKQIASYIAQRYVERCIEQH